MADWQAHIDHAASELARATARANRIERGALRAQRHASRLPFYAFKRKRRWRALAAERYAHAEDAWQAVYARQKRHDALVELAATMQRAIERAKQR